MNYENGIDILVIGLINVAYKFQKKRALNRPFMAKLFFCEYNLFFTFKIILIDNFIGFQLSSCIRWFYPEPMWIYSL